MARGAPLKPGVLPTLLGYRLRRAQQAVFRDFASAVAEISPGRAGMLLLIDANPGVTQGRLAQAVGLDRSTMVGGTTRSSRACSTAPRDDRHQRAVADQHRSQLVARSGSARGPRCVAAHHRAERAQLLSLLEKLAG